MLLRSDECPDTYQMLRHGCGYLPCWIGFAILVCATVSGCQRQPGDDASAGPAASPRRVTLLLNWFPEVEHGGFYAAEVHGYFADEGLEVEIQPGGPGAPVIQQVASGRCDFAVANADQVLLGRDQGAPVVAVLAAMQDSPHCIIVHSSSGIDSMLKLRDLTLAVGSGKPFAQYLLHKLGDAPLEVVPYQGSVGMFLERPDCAQQAYVFSEPYVAKQKGGDPRCLMLSEIGFNPYSSVLVVQSDVAMRESELVRKMARACVRGWRKYLEEPVAVNQHIHQLNPEMDLEALAFGADAIKKLCLPDPMRPDQLGHMNAPRWEQLAQQLREIGLLENPDTWSEAFDTQFLPSP